MAILIGTTLQIDQAYALGEFIPGGARSAGMGDAYVGLAEGAEGLLWNPGSAAIGSALSAVAGYDRPFEIRELETVSAASVLRRGRAGLGLLYQGNSTTAFSESTNGLVAGLRVNGVGAGVRLRHIQTRVGSVSSGQWLVFDLGILVASRRGIRVGLVGLNVGGTQTGILGQGGMAGLAVTGASTTLAVDVHKEAGTATGGAVGVEFRVSAVGRVRLGVGGHPERLTLGVGVRKGGAEIDYGILYHTVLGFTHRASVAFSR